MLARLSAIAVVFSLITLTGCVGSSKMGNESSNAPSVTIQNPPPQVVDTSKIDAKLEKVQSEIRNEIQTSTNSNQTHMNGLLDVSVNKLGERVTGVEANIKEAIGIKNELKAEINLKNELKSEINAVATNTANVSTRLDAVVHNTAELNVKVADSIKLTNEMAVKMNGQAGIGNSIKNIEEKINTTLTAGRDVNTLSHEAVVLVLGIFVGFFVIVIIAITWLGKNARDREAMRTQEERLNVERWQAVAMQAMSRLDPAMARDITLPSMTPPKA